MKGLSPDRSPDRVEAGTGRGRGIRGLRKKVEGGRWPSVAQSRKTSLSYGGLQGLRRTGWSGKVTVGWQI
jgi:hypothetical protein